MTDSETKKQAKFYLSARAHELLKAQAEKENVPMSTIIEELIYGMVAEEAAAEKAAKPK